MNKDQLLKKIEEIQKSVKQMVQDDLEENPEVANEEFQCDCCAEIKTFAGSMIYEDYRLCNDCVLLAEVGFALNKIKTIDEFMASTEDKRFETIYNTLFNVDEIEKKDVN